MTRTWTDTEPQTKHSTPFAKQTLPPDLDRMNHQSAELADGAISPYRTAHGLSRDEALFSLLVGLRHLCDVDTRYGDFAEKMAMANDVYEENTRASNDSYQR